MIQQGAGPWWPPTRKQQKMHHQNWQHQKLDQERLRQNSWVSMQKIILDIGISGRSVQRIAKEDLHLTSYKLQKVQLLTGDNKCLQIERSNCFLWGHAPLDWDRILFMDEMLFTVKQAHNRQNDRSWSTKAPGSSAIIKRWQNLQYVMIWGGIS